MSLTVTPVTRVASRTKVEHPDSTGSRQRGPPFVTFALMALGHLETILASPTAAQIPVTAIEKLKMIAEEAPLLDQD